MRSRIQFSLSALFVTLALFLISAKSFSQEKDTVSVKKDPTIFLKKDSAKISISAYVDGYYARYSDSVGMGNYQKFPSVSPRSNSFGLNVAHFDFQYNGRKARGVVALHYGDIERSAWSGNIMEAHAGIRLSKTIWLDGGFFRTHVGTEGLLPKENIASSVSVCTYMEPYFESGFRLNYNPNDKLVINLYVLNGYNIYQENNDKKSFGMLVTYAVNDNFNFGYSNYIGDDSPAGDTLSPLRVFNNLFLNFQSKKIKVQIGGDYVVQTTDDPNDPALVMGCIGTLRYQFQKKTGIYFRGEYFSDPQGFLSGTFPGENDVLSGLTVSGFTAGLEYKPTDNSYIRLEGRQLDAGKTKIFYRDGRTTGIRTEMMIHTGVSF
jgi:opacity protein-like surface antigen